MSALIDGPFLLLEAVGKECDVSLVDGLSVEPSAHILGKWIL